MAPMSSCIISELFSKYRRRVSLRYEGVKRGGYSVREKLCTSRRVPSGPHECSKGSSLSNAKSVFARLDYRGLAALQGEGNKINY